MKQQNMFIPIPDNTSLVEDYESLYPTDWWREPETVQGSLSHRFTYLMDEHNSEWLEKNNGEARGEGTSPKVLTSQCSAKVKGKEPDVTQPILHHGLEQGPPFPLFSEYQDTFTNKLSPDMIAAFTILPWIPQPEQLLCFAKAIYPYWRERQIEQGSHCIIPTLNYDKRRNVKAMCKTRASQASSSDKLLRLKQELMTAAELVASVLKRAAQQANVVWEKCEDLASLKRKFPSLLNAKEDEELFYDKEKVRRPNLVEPIRIVGLRIKSRDNKGDFVSLSAHHNAVVRLKECAAMIIAQDNRKMDRIKDCNNHWKDGIKNAYQPQPVPPSEPSQSASPTLLSSATTLDGHLSSPEWPAVRVRQGHGGVLCVDCHTSQQPMHHDELVRYPRRSMSSLTTSLEETEEQCASDREALWQICDRWLFNTDNKPSVGHNGTNEKDRMLYLLKGMSLYQEDDHQWLTTDPTIYMPSSDSHLLGTPSQAAAMQQHQQQMARQGAIRMLQTTGAPISIAAAMKKLPSALRPPVTPILTAITPSAPQTSPRSSPMPTATNSQTSPTPAPPSVNESEEPLSSSTPTQQLESATPSTEAMAGSLSTSSPMPIKPTQLHHALPLPNGYHLQNNYTAAMTNGIATYLHPCMQKNGLTVPQLWLKNAFTNGQQEWSLQSTACASLGLFRSTKAKGQGVASNDIVK
ncbi:hypothetical protein V8E53_012157 [Lactarius tabidus]